MGRSLKKGPYVYPALADKVEKLNQAGKKEIIKTWSRASMVTPEMLGHTIAVHMAAGMFRYTSWKTWSVTGSESSRRRGHSAGTGSPIRPRA